MEENKKTAVCFCPECGAPFSTIPTGRYRCPCCGEPCYDAVIPVYKVGDKVRWNDPNREPNETLKAYKERCNQVRVITDILRSESITSDSVVYELDNGTEAYEEELAKA